jgi:hypothetical protein
MMEGVTHTSINLPPTGSEVVGAFFSGIHGGSVRKL